MRGFPIGRTAVGIALAALLFPAPAGAHLRTGTVAVDYRAAVSIPRPAPGTAYSVGVYASDLALHLAVRPGHTVVVIGYLGEPFLRIGTSGVAVNLASPTAAAAGLLGKGQHASHGPAAWHIKHRGEVVVWHDSRVSLPPGARSGDWRVPVVVDGRPAEIAGRVERLRRPMLWPWLAVLTLFVGAASATARTRRFPRLAASCIALGVVACAAAVVTALGFALDRYASPGTWVAGVDEIAFAATGAAVLIWGPQGPRGGRAGPRIARPGRRPQQGTRVPRRRCAVGRSRNRSSAVRSRVDRGGSRRDAPRRNLARLRGLECAWCDELRVRLELGSAECGQQ